MPTNPAEEGARRPSERSRDEALIAEVIGSDGHDAECTIYPADAEGMDLMTRWITAAEGSFVRLEDVR